MAVRTPAGPRVAATARTYKAMVLVDAPVGFWMLDDPVGAATLADLSGNALNLTALGAILYQQGSLLVPRPGLSINAGLGAGIGIYPDIAALSFTSDFTLECWVQRPNTVASTYVLISKGNLSGGTTNLSYSLFIDGAQGITLRVSNNGSAISGVSTPANAVNNTNIHHIVATYQQAGKVVAIYVDGVRLAFVTTGPAAIFDSTASFRIGAGATNTDGPNVQFINGTMQACAVYNKVLSPGRILAHYAAGSFRLRALAGARTHV